MMFGHAQRGGSTIRNAFEGLAAPANYVLEAAGVQREVVAHLCARSNLRPLLDGIRIQQW